MLETKKEKVFAQHNEKVLILICAHNEQESLPLLLKQLSGKDVLVVDDGSLDDTRQIAERFRVNVISHKERMGKAVSLSDGISFALQNGFDIILEIGADASPAPGAMRNLLERLHSKDVGGASARQIPVGRKSVAFHIDELIWALLAEGKKLQMIRNRTSHLGAVMYVFRPQLVDSVEGSINDDERVGLSIKMRGYRTVFAEDSIVYFDASSSLGHIFQRRQRMYFGHIKYSRSTAPSMQLEISAYAMLNALRKKPKRIAWTIPALLLDCTARLLAWRDARKQDRSQKYSRWVTTYAKDNSLVIRNSARR